MQVMADPQYRNGHTFVPLANSPRPPGETLRLCLEPVTDMLTATHECAAKVEVTSPGVPDRDNDTIMRWSVTHKTGPPRRAATVRNVTTP